MRHAGRMGWAMRSALLGGLLALSGCVTGPAGRPAPPRGPGEYDPLVGGVPIPPSNAPGASGPPREELKPGALPPLPEAGGPSSPAALTRGAGGASTPARPGATLEAPRPKVEATPAPGGLQQTGAIVPASGDEASYEQLHASLRARGVVWQQLKNDNLRPEQWQFVCAIPDRNNRDIRAVYEGEGASPVAAMQDALRRIDRERK